MSWLESHGAFSYALAVTRSLTTTHIKPQAVHKKIQPREQVSKTYTQSPKPRKGKGTRVTGKGFKLLPLPFPL
ncbi:hypothetical protein [Anabaena azotica]|uniref:hypothetical protein n=1 Tax=Anabaena azotica TaxID=197653 RepID=UPI0016884F66|nr:hypothetical protein [Anabaena azotica]